MITPKMGPAFVETLPVGKFHGVGPATTREDEPPRNRNRPRPEGASRSPSFSSTSAKSGPYYYWIARGVDERPVRADRIRKSIGAENTFSADLFTFDAGCAALQPIIDKVWRYCEATRIRGRTVTLKVKYADFQQITRSRTGAASVATQAELEQISLALLGPVFPAPKGIRLLGVTLSSLGETQEKAEGQLNLCI